MIWRRQNSPVAEFTTDQDGEFVWDVFYRFECSWSMFVALDFPVLPFGLPMPIDPKLLSGVDGSSMEDYLVPLDCDFPQSTFLQAVAFMTEKDRAGDVVNGYSNSKGRWISTCRSNPAHLSQYVVESLSMELGGINLRPLVPQLCDELIVFVKEAADCVSSSDLRGAKFGPVELLDTGHLLESAGVTFHYLKFDAAPPLRLPRVVPESRNRCHRCGHGPLICHDCGARLGFTACPKCGVDTFVIAEDHCGERDPRIRIMPTSDQGQIVEVSRWNGEDFFGDLTYTVVTRRVLALLIAERIGPFTATPLRANIRGISKEKAALLKHARGQG